MSTVPKPFPREFREDVVWVACSSDASVAQVVKDFGISESCLHRWLALDDVDQGKRPGVSSAESAELRELRKRNKLLEQENEVLRRAAAYLSQANLPGSQGK
jgi:transposase